LIACRRGTPSRGISRTWASWTTASLATASYAGATTVWTLRARSAVNRPRRSPSPPIRPWPLEQAADSTIAGVAGGSRKRPPGSRCAHPDGEAASIAGNRGTTPTISGTGARNHCRSSAVPAGLAPPKAESGSFAGIFRNGANRSQCEPLCAARWRPPIA
jgi:hypothetical protein